MYKYRNIEKQILDNLAVFRIVSLTGARQVGKTTLAHRICVATNRRYVSFEDPVVRAAAEADPVAWLEANPPPLAIDEIQHVPGIFPVLKQRVDNHSNPGQYLITGSALWLSMKKIGESLAGRTAIMEISPFRVSEWLGKSWDWKIFFSDKDSCLYSLREGAGDHHALLWDSLLRGGYPEPASFATLHTRQTWHESYLRTYLQRDVIDLAHIERVAEFTRLIRMLAVNTGCMANQSALARDLGLPQPTVRRYLDWLHTTYQSNVLPPFSINIGKRMVKTPKLYWSDTGMACAFAGLQDRTAILNAQKSGALLETLVVNDLFAWSRQTAGAALTFWRSHAGGEADVLIERQGEVVAVEVKSGHRIDARDLKGLRECRQSLGTRFRRGIVLYGGKEPQGLEDRIIALPLSCLLGR